MAHNVISGCIKDVTFASDDTKDILNNKLNGKHGAQLNIQVYNISQRLQSFNTLKCDFDLIFMSNIVNSDEINKIKNAFLQCLNEIDNNKNNNSNNNLMKKSIQNKMMLNHSNFETDINLSMQINNCQASVTNLGDEKDTQITIAQAPQKKHVKQLSLQKNDV